MSINLSPAFLDGCGEAFANVLSKAAVDDSNVILPITGKPDFRPIGPYIA